MMKDRFLLIGILFLFLAVPLTFAQATDKTVEKIDLYYKQIAEKARLCETDDDQGEFGELVMNTLDINARGHQWRAVGIYRPVYKFFYRGVENDEKRLYPDQLVFAKAVRSVSSRTYNEEYLFSDKGELMLYRQKAEGDDTVPAERRVYFSGLRAIRIVEDGKTRDKLSVKDAATVREITAAGSKLMQIFKRSIDL